MDEAGTGLPTRLGPHDRRRLQSMLHERGLAARLEGSEVVFADASIAHETRTWVSLLSRYNAAIHRQARRLGHPIKPYKPHDSVNLIVAVLAGLERGPTGVAHEVIWMQPFPNANHRTVVAACADILDTQWTPEQGLAQTKDLFAASKRLLDGSDATYTDAEAKQEHLRLVQELIRRLNPSD